MGASSLAVFLQALDSTNRLHNKKETVTSGVDTPTLASPKPEVDTPTIGLPKPGVDTPTLGPPQPPKVH